MKEHFENIVFNTLNGTVDKLKGNANAFQNKLRTFSGEVGGTFTLPHAQFDSAKFDPRLKDLGGSLNSIVSLPKVDVQHKHWTITFLGWGLTPPPVGPMVIVSASCLLKPSVKLSAANKKRHDLNKLIASAAIPADKALREILKNAMPDFKLPTTVSPEDVKQYQIWKSLPESKTGVIELDHICKVFASDAKLGKEIFADWKAREAYLLVAKDCHFSVNGNKNMMTMMLSTNADGDQLKAALEFFKSVLDRSYALKIATSSPSA